MTTLSKTFTWPTWLSIHVTNLCERRALAASRAEADQLEEDWQLQETIRLSMAEDTADWSTSFQDQLRERSARMKRKAEEQLGPGSSKSSGSFDMNVSSPRTLGPTSLMKVLKTESKARLGNADSSKGNVTSSLLEPTSEVNAPKRSYAATRDISPPPLRRKVVTTSELNSHVTYIALHN
jgi:tyrosyl-DNA phosphodiesterase-1